MLQAGEVVLIPFPYTDLAAVKRRPVLVLRAPDSGGDFPAAAITSQADHADALLLEQADFSQGTLPKTSYIRTSKLYTLNQGVVVRHFGTLTPKALARAQAAICSALGCKY